MTSGPNLVDTRRFFFTVDQAVHLVLTAMKSAERFQGKVLSRKMKAATIADILRVWTAHNGSRWEKIEGRPGERNDEFLVGDLELPYTSEVVIDGVPHYLTSFNEKAAEPLGTGLSSANSDKLTDAEILQIIDTPPVEEVTA